MCLYQFLANVGWVFLATLMPTFLKDQKHMSDFWTGLMSSIALLIGTVGMFSGGWLTDMLTRRFGVRAGRMIPLAGSRVFGGCAYLGLLWYDKAWACVAVFAIIAIVSDLSVPATWAYVQDVGGRNVAAAFAWPNMWGNIGAFLTPNILIWINDHLDRNHDWHESFIFQGVSFLLAGIVALGIKADEKLSSDDQDDRGFPVILLPPDGSAEPPEALPS
jgi:MFS family permease